MKLTEKELGMDCQTAKTLVGRPTRRREEASVLLGDAARFNVELPPRPQQILELLIQGRTPEEIALILGVQPSVVREHRSRARKAVQKAKDEDSVVGQGGSMKQEQTSNPFTKQHQMLLDACDESEKRAKAQFEDRQTGKSALAMELLYAKSLEQKVDVLIRYVIEEL